MNAAVNGLFSRGKDTTPPASQSMPPAKEYAYILERSPLVLMEILFSYLSSQVGNLTHFNSMHGFPAASRRDRVGAQHVGEEVAQFVWLLDQARRHR